MTACIVVPPRRTTCRAPTWRRAGDYVVLFSAVLAALAAPAYGQLIAVKTVPIAQADQFDIFPSRNLGMAGVSIAVDDPLLDPFVNPAKSARLRSSQFFGSPTFYSVSRKSGGGRALPLGALVRSGSWFGGLALALQEVDPARRDVPLLPSPLELTRPGILPAEPVPPRDERPRNNRFAFATIGRVFPERQLSLGASVRWAGLRAVDGVDMLYLSSQRLEQAGRSLDLRLGLLKEWNAGQSFEALVVHDRLGMTHDVTYAELFWDPDARQVVQRPRLEQNLDRTRTWGVHLEYERPLAAPGWRVGGLLTGNLTSHPTIPDYELPNVPWHPGQSHGYNIGVGISKMEGPSTVGLDVVYEPIWSYTWAATAEPLETGLGATIPAGGKTLENRFRFSNALVRLGLNQDLVGRSGDRIGSLQFGVGLRSTHYWLEQRDNLQASERDIEERWLEWTYAWGASLHFSQFELRYRGRYLSGTGRPAVALGGVIFPDVPPGPGIVAPPLGGQMTLEDVSITTHQFSVSLPIR
jgi:hypothetical protein